jgi:hypothetical protein
MRILKPLVTAILFASNAVLAQQPFGKSILLDGKGTYVSAPGLDVLDSCGQFTIECRVKTDNDDPAVLMNKWSCIIDGESTWNRHHQGWLIDLNRSINPLTHNSPFLPLDADTTTGGVRMLSVTSYFMGEGHWKGGLWEAGWDTIAADRRREWNHVALCIDRTKDHQQADFFINGEGRNNGYQTGQEDWDLSVPGRPLNMGGFSEDIDSTLFLHGRLDEVRIWNRRRSAVQIQASMEDTLDPSLYARPDSGLIAYYRFDRLEDLGVGGDGCDDIRDLTGNGRHADIIGNALLVESNAQAGVSKRVAENPSAFGMMLNFPNPFNSSTTVRFKLKRTGPVRLTVYNLLGETVAVPLDRLVTEGLHSIRWNAGNAPSGVYLCRIETADGTGTIRMLLQK